MMAGREPEIQRSSELQNLSTNESFQDSAIVADSSLNVDELKTVPKWKRWTSIFVLCFTMVDIMSTYSIVITSLFPYLLHLTGGQSPTIFLGWVMAGYSLGRFVMSPVCGFWSDKRPTREPLIVCFMVSIVANFAYCYAGALPSGGQYVVLVARIFVGGCAGSAAVVRSYVAAATTEEERTWGLALSSGSQTLGVLIGPLMSLIFIPLGDRGISIPAIRFHFNMYTGPVYFNILMDIINLLLLAGLFREYKINFKKLHKGKDLTRKDVDWVAVVVALILIFFVYATIGLVETIAVPYSMDEFAWTRQQAILYNSFILGVYAVSMAFYYIIIAYISKWVQYRIMIMIGLFIIEFAYLLFIPMSNIYPKLMGDSLDNSTVAVGCRNQQLSWCNRVPQILLPKFVAGMLLMTVGYSASVLPNFTLYSRILGPFPQGMMMGVLTAVGSVSRAVSPLFVTFMYDLSGPQITFASVMAFHSIAIWTLLVFCYRMVPFKQRRAL